MFLGWDPLAPAAFEPKMKGARGGRVRSGAVGPDPAPEFFAALIILTLEDCLARTIDRLRWNLLVWTNYRAPSTGGITITKGRGQVKREAQL